MHVVVVGAGAFGGWAALFLRRLGVRVTLVDAWGPGNSRPSSGGETRIIRSIYGEDQTSVRMAARSLALWKEYELRWQTALYLQTGVIFLAAGHDPFLAASRLALTAEGIPFEDLSIQDAARRFSQFDFHDIESVMVEPEAGVLFARQNCRTVVDRFVAEGGEFHFARARPSGLSQDEFAVELSNGETLAADAYVFACGPWLGKLFPEVLGHLIQPTRQEVLFIGTPPGDPRFDAPQMPCWADRACKQKFYGLPNVEHRGFKVASDLRGRIFDPETEDRTLAPTTWTTVQAYLRHRFPLLSDAPLVESRVCQYENSPDLGLIVDRHPQIPQVWLVGGGSGHGYKHGPAIGEHVAALVTGACQPSSEWSLARFVIPPASHPRVSTI